MIINVIIYLPAEYINNIIIYRDNAKYCELMVTCKVIEWVSKLLIKLYVHSAVRTYANFTEQWPLSELT